MFLLEIPYTLKSYPYKPSNGTKKWYKSHEKCLKISCTPQITIKVSKIAKTCSILDVETKEKKLEPITIELQGGG